jgi:benzil reductase ((S)-benzoin forming)
VLEGPVDDLPTGVPLVVVTGASAGLGRALLAAAPSDAVRVDVSRSGPPPEADVHLGADLADPDSWGAVASAVEELLHRVSPSRTVVVHNAGVLEPIGFAGEVDDDAYVRNVVLNAAAPQVLGHLLLRALGELPGDRTLAMISSGAARTAYPGWSAYGAAKAAVDQWVRAVGEEQRRRGGVRVLSIAPGVVATAMQALIRDSDERDFPPVTRFRRLYDEGALASAEEAARAVWAVLDDATVTTGEVTDVRGR